MIHRGALIRMVVIAAVAAIIATLVAVLIRWLPESASEQMDRITFVFGSLTIICIGIFSLVAAVIVEAVWAFRVQPDDDTDGPPIHGNTKLEIAWTIVPAILVISIGVVSAVVLSKNANAGSHPLEVKVFAQQFAWRFEYPGNVRSEELVMPLHRSVEFHMQSVDVIHSLWIPQMGQKQDVVPGITTKMVITPTRAGNFALICTELCGLGHATMRAPVRVLSSRRSRRGLRSSVRQARRAARAPEEPRVAGRQEAEHPPAPRLRSARRRSPRPAAAAATRSSPPERTPRSGPTSTTCRRREEGG